MWWCNFVIVAILLFIHVPHSSEGVAKTMMIWPPSTAGYYHVVVWMSPPGFFIQQEANQLHQKDHAGWQAFLSAFLPVWPATNEHGHASLSWSFSPVKSKIEAGLFKYLIICSVYPSYSLLCCYINIASWNIDVAYS